MTEINEIRLEMRNQPENWDDISLVKTITFPHSQKVYKGVPIIMTGRWTLQDVQWLTKHDVLSAHGPGSADELVDYYTNADHTHRTVFDLNATDLDVVNFFEVYSQVVDKTKMKFVRFNLGDITQEAGCELVRKFRKLVPNMVVIAGHALTVDRAEALYDAGADVVALGHPEGNGYLNKLRLAGVDLALADLIETASDTRYSGVTLADVGCSSAADVIKAFACGAEFVGFGNDMGQTSLQSTFESLRIACATQGNNIDLQNFAAYAQYFYVR